MTRGLQPYIVIASSFLLLNACVTPGNQGGPSSTPAPILSVLALSAVPASLVSIPPVSLAPTAPASVNPPAPSKLVPGTILISGQIMIDASSQGALINKDQLGDNLPVWYDITKSGISNALLAIGTHLIRWPGGSASDKYHWQNHSMCDNGGFNPNSTFDNFMQDVALPGKFDVAITVDYGSNPTCNGGGDPKEAAAWAAYAKAKGYPIRFWTVGNENYGGWEYDLHAARNDPTTYANAMAGPNGYYNLIRQQDPNALVGVPVAGKDNSNWDKIVLAQAQYDFVELHWYPEGHNTESDMDLLTKMPSMLADQITFVRAELAAAGKPNTQIYLGEYNADAYAPGKQSVSIVNGLFMGLALGEILKAGVPRASWWLGLGGGCGAMDGNNSPSLYGAQNFGTFSLMSDGCPSMPLGTPFPPGRAQQLVSQFAIQGNQMLSVTVNPALANVRAYAATQFTGYAALLFNLDMSNAAQVSVGIANAPRTSYAVSTLTYGKAQYDDSKHGVWTAPVSQDLGALEGPFNVTLPPWSMMVLKLL